MRDDAWSLRCNDINHLNECTVIGIKFGAIMPHKSNMALIDAVFHETAHHGLFPLHGVDLLSANTKQHLLTTASVLNAATATIVSIYVNIWNDITWWVG